MFLNIVVLERDLKHEIDNRIWADRGISFD